MRFTIDDAKSDMAAVHGRISRLLVAALAILVMLMLKRHYSLAGPDQLSWILLPTARLTAWLTHANPVMEAGIGYADFSRGIIIAPACAGVNFMIMAYGLAVFCGLGRLRRFFVLTAWMAFSLVLAYLLALGVNALRIALSMALYRVDIRCTGLLLTPDTLHRLAGVCVYLGALGLFFKGLEPIISAVRDRFDPQCRSVSARRPAWLPLGWYLAGAVGVPAANLVFQPPLPAFGEHCLTVTAAAVGLWVGAMGMAALLRQDRNRNGIDGDNSDCGR